MWYMIWYDIFVNCSWVDSRWQQYSTVQYSTVQYSTVQYSTLQYSTVQYSTVQYSTVQYSTVHIYTQTIHRTTQLTDWEECEPCPIFASYTLAFALQLRKKHAETSVRVEHGKTSVRVVICADRKFVETMFYKMWNTTKKKKMWVTTTIFVVLEVKTFCCLWTPVLFVSNTHHFTECNSCLLYTKLHKHDGQTLRRMAA
jgi:hypothetical protein